MFSNITQLKISAIRTDCGTQTRVQLDTRIIAEYAESLSQGEEFPPITVFYDQQHYYLADGFHRLEATIKTGALTIAAEVKSGSCREAILYSVASNAQHGLRRSKQDKRKAVLTLLSDPQWSIWSNREIAKQCHVAEGLVRKIKRELSAYNTQINYDYQKTWGVNQETFLQARQLLDSASEKCTAQRQNKTYTINTAKIGKSSPSWSDDYSLENFENGNLINNSSEIRPVLETVNQKEKIPLNKTNVLNLGCTKKNQSVLLSSDGALTLPDQSNNCFRIIKVEQENVTQFPESDKTFEIKFANIRIVAQGDPTLLSALFEQLQSNPHLFETICGIADLTKTSHQLLSLKKNLEIA